MSDFFEHDKELLDLYRDIFPKAQAEINKLLLELKDAFPEELREGVSDISVKVRMLNINKGRNKMLMESCKPLSEYAWFIEEIRENKRREMEIEEAVDRALDEMPEDFSIREFLMENRAEVKDMCLTEYNEEETMQMFKEEGRREGEKRGEERGEKKGENKLGQLVFVLLASGRHDDIEKAATDENARQILYKEFHII